MIARAPFGAYGESAQGGSPTVVDRSHQDRGLLDFFLQTNPEHASSARLLTSVWFDAGIPGDGRRRFTIPSQLAVAPFFDFSSFFSASGTFAGELTSAIVKVYVEESDAAGNFVRAMESAEIVLLREDLGWFAASMSSPGAHNLSFPDGEVSLFDVQPNFQYRVFVDLHGEVRAAGYQWWGGSGAIAQVQLTVNGIVATYFEGP